jgi:hypothetical protein
MFVPGKLYQPSVMFLSEVVAYLSLPYWSDLTDKYYTWLVMPTMHKHSSSLGPFIIYKWSNILWIRPRKDNH